ncbi:MAG: winged helix DNA-binding domain-containing protein [Actinocrinis sp.]
MTGTGSGDRLTDRAVNRATLARQHLLQRQEASARDEIAHLAGMQAQAPLAPYVGLWTRLESFATKELSALYERREVVRLALMRGTIHLVTAQDALAWRALVEPVITRGTDAAFGKHYSGLDRDAVVEAARELTEQAPRTFAELGPLLAERFPGRDPAALAQLARARLPLIQIPPRGVWGATGRIAHTTARAWLGDERAAQRGQTPEPRELDQLVRCYLAAFGPATIMDAQAWSGLTKLREVFDRLAPALRTFTAENGAQLYDLPNAPRPAPDAPAPARFLPEYDNLLFSHADRTRVNPSNHRIPLFPGNGAALGYYLLDGTWHGLWRIDRPRKPKKQAKGGQSATTVTTSTTAAARREQARGEVRLTIQPFTPLTATARDQLTTEGRNLLAFLAPDAASADIQFAPATS